MEHDHFAQIGTHLKRLAQGNESGDTDVFSILRIRDVRRNVRRVGFVAVVGKHLHVAVHEVAQVSRSTVLERLAVRAQIRVRER